MNAKHRLTHNHMEKVSAMINKNQTSCSRKYTGKKTCAKRKSCFFFLPCVECLYFGYKWIIITYEYEKCVGNPL